jgi:hypothetical protein
MKADDRRQTTDDRRQTSDVEHIVSSIVHRPSSIVHRLPRLALAILLAGLLWKGAASAQLSSALFAYPFQFDESESMIVAETQLLDRGVNIYMKPGPDLFISAPYPPLFYLLAGPAQYLVGLEPTFKIGRAISVIATLLAGALLFGLVLALTRDRLAGALAAALWWSLGLVAFWGSLVKPDMLALALGLAGLWWLLARPPNQVWRALPFFLGAFFTKQTAIAAGVAAVAWLLLTRPRAGLAFGAAYAAGAMLPTLTLNLLTQGGYFYHMYTLHDLPWFPGRFLQHVQGFLAAYGAFLLPGAAAIVVSGALWLSRRLRGLPQVLPRDGALLVFFYLGMSLVASIGAGTHGGNHNHFLDLAAASCLGLGLGAGLMARARSWPSVAAGALLALLLVAQVPALFATPRWLGLELRVPPQTYTDGLSQVFQYVTNNSGEAYSDNVGLLLSAGKRLWTTDLFTQTHATQFGRWDESALVQAIQDRRFSQIVFRIDVFAPDAGAGDISPGILQAVRDNYKLDQRNVENIYVPR